MILDTPATRAVRIEEADCRLCSRRDRSGEYARCPDCGRNVRLTRRGCLRAHPRRGRCAGVGRPMSGPTIVTGEFVQCPAPEVSAGYRLTDGCEATHGVRWREVPSTDPRYAGFVAKFLDMVAERGEP